MHRTRIHVIFGNFGIFHTMKICEEERCPTEYIFLYMFSAIIRNSGKHFPQKYNIELFLII